MSGESERINEIKNYIDATIAEIDGHTEKMEELFKADKPGKDKELYEIIINSYERHRNTLKRIQKMIDGEKVESEPGIKDLWRVEKFIRNLRN